MTVGLLLICARCYLEWRKGKHNATREDRSTVAISKSARIPWRISPKTEPLADAGDRMGLTRVHRQPFLFAIARDARTISPVGTLIGDASLKPRCPRIDKSIFE